MISAPASSRTEASAPAWCQARTSALAPCQAVTLVLATSWAMVLTLSPAQVVNSALGQYWAAISAWLHLGLQFLLLPVLGRYLGSGPTLVTTLALATYHAVSSALAIFQATASAPGWHRAATSALAPGWAAIWPWPCLRLWLQLWPLFRLCVEVWILQLQLRLSCLLWPLLGPWLLLCPILVCDFGSYLMLGSNFGSGPAWAVTLALVPNWAATSALWRYWSETVAPAPSSAAISALAHLRLLLGAVVQYWTKIFVWPHLGLKLGSSPIFGHSFGSGHCSDDCFGSGQPWLWFLLRSLLWLGSYFSHGFDSGTILGCDFVSSHIFILNFGSSHCSGHRFCSVPILGHHLVSSLVSDYKFGSGPILGCDFISGLLSLQLWLWCHLRQLLCHGLDSRSQLWLWALLGRLLWLWPIFWLPLQLQPHIRLWFWLWPPCHPHLCLWFNTGLQLWLWPLLGSWLLLWPVAGCSFGSSQLSGCSFGSDPFLGNDFSPVACSGQLLSNIRPQLWLWPWTRSGLQLWSLLLPCLGHDSGLA